MSFSNVVCLLDIYSDFLCFLYSFFLLLLHNQSDSTVFCRLIRKCSRVHTNIYSDKDELNQWKAALESNASKHSIRAASSDGLSDVKAKANGNTANECPGRNDEPTSTVAKRSHETHEAERQSDPQLPGDWVWDTIVRTLLPMAQVICFLLVKRSHSLLCKMPYWVLPGYFINKSFSHTVWLFYLIQSSASIHRVHLSIPSISFSIFLL